MVTGLNILLVDDKPNERTAIRRLLTSAELSIGNIEECGAGAEAHSTAYELKPDIIFVAFEEPIARPLKTIENLANNKSSLVIAISSMSDSDYLRKAMRAGAREYLAKPIKPKDLARAIQDVMEEERRRKNLADSGKIRGDVFTVIGPKGGIGKTTIAANLAVSLAVQTQQRVALVDLALQLGDVAMMLDIVPERTIADMANFARVLEPEVLENFLSPHSSGVKVLAAATDVDPKGLPSAPLVGQTVDTLARSYDYVVIDGDCLLTPVLWAALELTTLILLVTSPDTSSLKNTRVFLEVLRSQGYTDDKIKLFINYPYQQNGISTGELNKILNYPIFWKVPHDAVCHECGNQGQPFVQARPKAKISQNVLQLARTISGTDTKRKRLFGRK
ncbi:MAG: response regulator [Dehalococcoidia bacterium]|nr:response regulator [Dehalococcoidia bacterium]